MPKEKRPEKNYYEILRISRDATRQDVVKAYEQIKEAFGPQSMAVYSLVEEEERRSIMDKIEKAFTVLTDDVRRAKYNSQLDRPDDETAPMFLQTGPPPEAVHDNKAKPAPVVSETQPAEISPATESNASSRSGSEQDDAAKKTPETPSGETLPEKAEPVEVAAKPKAGLPFDPSKFSDFDGKALKQIREALGINLSEVSEKTKIGKTFLQFLEDNKYEFLPAEVYVKGFVKQIAAMYGLNSSKVAESYIALYKKATHKKQ